MTMVNKTTKKADAIRYTFYHCNAGKNIFCAYNKPSYAKIASFNAIEKRAIQTSGYNHDLKVSNAGCQNYSTTYSYTQNGITYIVYDTKCNTYVVEA